MAELKRREFNVYAAIVLILVGALLVFGGVGIYLEHLNFKDVFAKISEAALFAAGWYLRDMASRGGGNGNGTSGS